MSERMLRLLLTQGGLGVPDVRQEVAISRVASWLRILNGDTVAATVLHCEMQRVCRFTHNVVVIRKGDNVIPLWFSAPLETSCER